MPRKPRPQPKRKSLSRIRLSVLRGLFPNQLAVRNDPAKKKCIWTTRRAGKTTTVLADFIDDGLAIPGSKYVFVAITLQSAETIAWDMLHKMDKAHGIGIDFKDAKLKAILPGGSYIRLYGADKPGWAARIYGQSLRKAAIDEAAFYRVDIKNLIDDYIEPCVLDQDGEIYVMSIPGHIPRGLFWDITKGWSWSESFSARPSETMPGWSCHRWTTYDNPYARDLFMKKIAQLKAENPDIESDPSFIRNYLGGWVTEIGERVYAFDEKKNTAARYEKLDGDQHILGVDFGWDDATAFSLDAWGPGRKEIVEIESFKQSGMFLDDIASYVKYYMEAFPNLRLVGDPAHKQLFEEFRRRYQLPLIEGEKPNKYDWIATINSDFRASTIKIVNPKESPHCEEMSHLVWKVRPNDGRRVEQPGLPNDCCDAFLLAYRQAYHYRFEPEYQPPTPGSKEFYDAEEKRIEEYLEAELDDHEYN